MSLLLDTHIVLALAQQTFDRSYPRIARAFDEQESTRYVSVASLWEIAIKTRIGKLDLGMSLEGFAAYVDAFALIVIPIERRHAFAFVSPEPPTRDPFDRMLLAQCAVEGLRLVTVDRSLVDHPLAWRPG